MTHVMVILLLWIKSEVASLFPTMFSLRLRLRLISSHIFICLLYMLLRVILSIVTSSYLFRSISVETLNMMIPNGLLEVESLGDTLMTKLRNHILTFANI